MYMTTFIVFISNKTLLSWCIVLYKSPMNWKRKNEKGVNFIFLKLRCIGIWCNIILLLIKLYHNIFLQLLSKYFLTWKTLKNCLYKIKDINRNYWTTLVEVKSKSLKALTWKMIVMFISAIPRKSRLRWGKLLYYPIILILWVSFTFKSEAFYKLYFVKVLTID